MHDLLHQARHMRSQNRVVGAVVFRTPLENPTAREIREQASKCLRSRHCREANTPYSSKNTRFGNTSSRRLVISLG